VGLKQFLLLFALLVCPAQPDTRKLTILHTNDLHARLLPTSEHQGGLAHLATAIRRERGGCDHCIMLDGGDMVQGTPVSTLYKGLPVYEIANKLGIDVSTLGNHEFDYGWQMIPRFRGTAKFPIVSSNVSDGTRLLADSAYVIREVNGIRVGIIGAVLGDLAGYTTPDLSGNWRALPVVETVRKHAADLKARTDLVVVVGHINEGPEILRQVTDVAVVVSGHDHRGLKEPLVHEGRLEVRVQSYGIELGRLDLEVDVPAKKVASWNWKRIPIDSRSIPPASDVAARVAKWEGRVSKIVDVQIGQSKRKLGLPEVRGIIERAMIDELGADLAFMNSGGVRDTIPQGDVLARHVWNVMPFDNRTAIGKLRGRQVPEAVRRGQNLEPDREYTVAVPDFVAVNQQYMKASGLDFPRRGPLLRDLIISWIKKKKVLE
jgi:5'-nucleotidase / UDP-sugar diphosphatase